MAAASQHPLAGLRVVEIAGLAPGPFAGMILADFGADVIRVDKIAEGTTDVLARGKRSISLNLKSQDGRDVLFKLMASADVVIDPFRPGVLEKMGLGPDRILAANPRCIFARLTGFGQNGPFAKMAGHDINYIAITGALAAIGRAGENPMFPANILGDFAGGGMLCAMGILIALIERQRSGLGQVVDAAMVDGASYLSSFIVKMRQKGAWNAPKGENMLDSGAPFYETYKTKDGKYMSVGCIEHQFYSEFIRLMELDPSTIPEQLDSEPEARKQLKAIFTAKFLTKTRDEWAKIFDGTDACTVPIIEWDEVMQHPHNVERQLWIKTEKDGPADADNYEPRPAPRLSRTPGRHAGGFVEKGEPDIGEHTVEVLKSIGYSESQIKDMAKGRHLKAKL